VKRAPANTRQSGVPKPWASPRPPPPITEMLGMGENAPPSFHST
jgi:hypothetical protein